MYKKPVYEMKEISKEDEIFKHPTDIKYKNDLK